MFTLVTIFLISIFVFILYSRSSTVMMEQQKGTAERTEAIVVNLFTQTLTDEYLTSIAKVASANAIRAMLLYINETRTSLTDPEAFYKDIVVNGSIEGAYIISSASDEIAMNIEILNSTQIIVYESTPDGVLYFGDTTTAVQPIHAEASLEDIQYITVNITNETASSGDLYLILYNDSEDGAVLMLDHQIVSIAGGSTEEVRFNIDGHNPLSPDTLYYVMLAAPFAGAADAYSVNATSSNPLAEDSSQIWVIDETGTANQVPIDFYLSYPVIGKGFLRALMGSFESLGKEKLNIDTFINLTALTIDEDIWEIGINATFLVSTEKTTVSFSDIYSEGIGEISIIGMYDPLSILQNNILTEERQFLQISSQNVSDDFSEADMYTHLSEKTFVFNENAPSFLGRFAGTDAEASSCCGIQTVYLDSDFTSAVVDEDKWYSYVDYKFQNSAQCTSAGENPLYYLNPSLTELSAIVTGQSPLLAYEDIEFYHMEDIAGAASCPASSTTT